MPHDLTLEDPNLDTAGAIGGLRRRRTVINVGTQRMQRYATFAIPFHTRDFSAAEASGTIDPDAQRTKTHRGLHRTLHGTTESNATF